MFNEIGELTKRKGMVPLRHQHGGHHGCLALARLNRQIRAEYRPLLMAKTHFLVLAETSDKFFAAFFLVTGKAENEIVKYNGDVDIMMPPEAAATFDLRPLITVVLLARQFNAIFAALPKMWPGKWNGRVFASARQEHVDDLNLLLIDLSSPKSTEANTRDSESPSISGKVSSSKLLSTLGAQQIQVRICHGLESLLPQYVVVPHLR
jgi:hypothetical protein